VGATAEALEKVVAALRRRCPKVRVILRADANFSRDELMSWCESQKGVYYVFGFARNENLLKRIEPALVGARMTHCLSGAVSTRRFTEFSYQTARSWDKPRRVIGKAEVTPQREDVRFVVSNLPGEGFEDEPDKTRFDPARLYEELYCGRGEMENVLKQQVLDLQADRMSTHYLASNQLRLWLATLAYLLLDRVRTPGCHGTDLARATAGSVRLKLLKVAAVVRVSVRRVCVQMSSAYPLQNLFKLCQQRLRILLAQASG
jgi:Transposase DDE domain group 1